MKPLPRGLINREGTPVTPSQRLPSLRTRSLANSAPAVMHNTTGQTTRGGVAKRVFKPNIPARRPAASDTSESTANDSHSKSDAKRGRAGQSPRGGRGAHSDAGKRQLGKNFVQLDAAVFSGIDAASKTRPPSAAGVPRAPKEEKIAIKRDPSPSKSSTRKNIITKGKALSSTIYRDDFIVDDDEDDEEDVQYSNKLPRGWEHVTGKRTSANDNSSTLNCTQSIAIDRWLDADDNLVLMQVPEFLVKRTSGSIGKLRVYNSGRIELFDEEAGVSYDIMRANNAVSEPAVKVEGRRKRHTVSSQGVRQELVVMKENSLTCLGDITPADVLMSVPRIPD